MRIINLPLVAVALSSSLCGLLRAEESIPKFDDAALKRIPSRMKEFVGKEISGAVTLVETRDRVVSLEAVGESDLANHTPMKTDSVFWIASMTKPITATAVMMLLDEGKLSIDDPVGKFLPELAHLKTADGAEHVVTLKHLLTHSSGLADSTHEEGLAAKTLADLIPHFPERPLHFVPGSKWSYSQAGINSLGRIVEVVSGESFDQFLQKRLFDPLAMKDTTFCPTRVQVARLAKSYKLENGELHEARPMLPESGDPANHQHYPAPNGGLYSTASDYGRFLRMVLNGGSLDGHQYLKPETVKLMTSIQSGTLQTGFTPGNGWGLGWCVVREPQGVSEALSPGSFGHGGAFGTQAWADPVRGVAYVLLVQRAIFQIPMHRMFERHSKKPLQGRSKNEKCFHFLALLFCVLRKWNSRLIAR